MDDVARACAVLGVSANVSLPELRRRYRSLVRQWHPDRFADDPAGQAEAATRMRQINDAYRLVVDQVAAFQEVRAAVAGRAPDGRLPREEIERLVRSIGTEGPIDRFIARVDENLANERVLGILAGLGLCWLLVRLGLSPWHVLWIAPIVAGLVALWRRARRHSRHSV